MCVRKFQIVFLLVTLFLMSCSKHVNQYKAGKKSGKWVYKNKTDGYSTGRYRNGVEKGIWKYFESNKLYRIERHKGNISSVKFYYPNRKISSKGQTRMDANSTEIHWYYYGKWTYYNERGKITEIRTYEKGKMIDEKVYYNPQ